MSTLVITIKEPEAVGISTSVASTIKAQFQPMLDLMVEKEKEFNEIVEQEYSPELAKRARLLRLELVKVRTSVADIHKQQKEFYRQGGLYVDGWKNAQLFAGKPMEEELAKIEKREEIEAQERLEALERVRIAEISPYVDNPATLVNLGTMPEEQWGPFLLGMKASYEQRLKAKEEAEQQERKRQETLKIINLRKIEVAQFKGYVPQDEMNAMVMADTTTYQEFIELAKKWAEDKAIEAARVLEENAKLRAEQEAEAKKNAEVLAKLQAEKEEAERKVAEEKAQAKAEWLAKEKAIKDQARMEALQAQDKKIFSNDQEQLSDLIQCLEVLTEKYTFQDPTLVATYANFGKMVAQVNNQLAKFLNVKS